MSTTVMVYNCVRPCFQGHAVLGARAGHGRQEPAGRRRRHQDEVPQRQQPHHQVGLYVNAVLEIWSMVLFS